MTPSQETITRNDIDHIEIQVQSQEPQSESLKIDPLSQPNAEPVPEEKDYYDTVDYDQMIQNQVKKQAEMRENRNAIEQLRKKRKMAEQQEMKKQRAAEEAAKREERNRARAEEELKKIKEAELDHDCLEKLDPKILS
jgi:hypothetical protein